MKIYNLFKLLLRLWIKQLKSNFYFMYKLCFGKLTAEYDSNGFIVLEKSNSIYKPIAKAGCSAIKKSLWERESTEKIEVELGIHGIVNNSEIFRLKMSKKYDFGFTFVRNPFERIVSFYINKFIDCNKEILGGKPGFLYENYLCNCFNQNMSFIDVVEIISDIPDHVSEKHFRSQSYDVALLTRSVNTVFIGRLENLKNDLEIVYQTTGEFIVGHINKSSRYNYMDYYDLKSLNVIYERYKSDVIDFGYEEEYVRIKRYIEGRDL